MRSLPILAALALAAGALVPPAGAQADDWTFLVYMDADNNLEEWGIADFLEMATVGSTDNVNIVVQFDRIAGFDSSYGDWTGTKRFYVTPGLTPDPQYALSDLGEVNMADPANLTAFVEWGMASYPADHYFLVLWDHGDGWQGVVTDSDPVPNDRLTLLELRDALRAVVTNTGRRVDLLGIDACRMTLEIVYELVDYADYFVGSEKDEPLPGWPYHTFLPTLTANPSLSPPDVASALVDAYVVSYQGTSPLSVALSVVNGTALRPLASSLDAFLTEVSSEQPYFTAEVVLARDATEHYEIGGVAGGLEYDLYDFVDNVVNATGSRRIERAGDALRASIEAAVVYERHWDNPAPANGVRAARAHGISLYFPATGGGAAYAALALSQDTLWDEFLATFAVGTRPQVAANATASSVDGDADAYLDTLVLRYTPAVDGTMAVDVYRDDRYALSCACVAVSGRTSEVRYRLREGGRYEVSFFLFAGGTLQNLTVVRALVIEQLVTFQGRVLGTDGSPIRGASVTLVDLANGRAAAAAMDGERYMIAVVYPTWFDEGDALELRVVAGDREARVAFPATAGNGTVTHDVVIDTAGLGLWIGIAVLAVVAAAGVAGTLYFLWRLRRFTRPP